METNGNGKINSEGIQGAHPEFGVRPLNFSYFLGFGLAAFFFFAAVGFFFAFFLGAGFFGAFALGLVFAFAFFLGRGLALGLAGRVGSPTAGLGSVSAGDSISGSEVSSCPVPALSGDSS